MSVSGHWSRTKAFSKCSLSDLAHVVAASARALDPATAGRLLPALRNAALTEAVLLRHPLVRDRSGLKCDGSASSERAWCGMLRDLVAAAGVDVSDAALLRVYLVFKECAKQGGVQLPLIIEYHDCFLGRIVRVPVVQLLQTIAIRHQIDAPLKLVKAASWIRLRRGCAGSKLPPPPPPAACLQVAVLPSQRARSMPAFTAMACDRASTAPASLNVYSRTASFWRTRILQRVMRGHVSKVLVRWLLRGRAALVLLTRAAANSGRLSGWMLASTAA